MRSQARALIPILSYISSHLISSHLSPLTLEVVGAPQMTLQQYLSIFPCLPLPSGNLQTPFPYIPWCYLPISSAVFLSFLLLSLSLAELSSPCQRILRCGHTIWVSVSLPWLEDHHALQLHSGFCCEPQKSPIASHLKGLDPSLCFCCQGPALTGIKEGVSIHITRYINSHNNYNPCWLAKVQQTVCPKLVNEVVGTNCKRK